MQKIGMFSIIKESKIIPVTMLKTSDIKVYATKNKKHSTMLSFFKKPICIEHEFKDKNLLKNLLSLESITISDMSLAEKDKVNITGYSKGKGFCGVIKKYGFSRLKETHGTSATHRSRGSCGQRNPNRVIKNTKMSGRHGNKRTTIKNLEIVKIIDEKNIIAIKGSIPGCNGSISILYK